MLRLHIDEMATVHAMLAEARKAIAAGKTEEGRELLAWAETELGRHLEVNVAEWKRVAG
jgi:hypothetical protein